LHGDAAPPVIGAADIELIPQTLAIERVLADEQLPEGVEAERRHALAGDDRDRRRGQRLDIRPAGQTFVGGDADQQLPIAVVGRLVGARPRPVGLAAAQEDRFNLGDAHPNRSRLFDRSGRSS
jgi:hypothetical protein